MLQDKQSFGIRLIMKTPAMTLEAAYIPCVSDLGPLAEHRRSRDSVYMIVYISKSANKNINGQEGCRNLHRFKQLHGIHLHLHVVLNSAYVLATIMMQQLPTIIHSRPFSPSSSRHISDCGAPRSLSNVYCALGCF